MLTVQIVRGHLVMGCAECAGSSRRGWVVPMSDAEAVAAAVQNAVDHGADRHGNGQDSAKNRPTMIDNGR